MRIGIKCSLMALSLAAGASLASGATAQETVVDPAAANGDDASRRLQTVTVTATKRSEDVQSIPVSVTALSEVTLEAAQVDAIRDLAVLTPGLQMAQRSTTWTPYIRGIGTQESAAGTEAGVSTYVDGVYMSSPWAASLAFNNVERVEVLKGPQGTLFGRNATGGLVHIITRDPQQETLVKGNVGFGDYDTITGQLYATTGFGPNLSGDIALNYKDQGEGYGRNVVSGNQISGSSDFGVRTKWILDLDSVQLTFSADHSEHETAQGDNRALAPGSITPLSATTVFSSLPGFYDVQLDTEPLSKTENTGASLTVDWGNDAIAFRSITAYRETTNDSVFDNDGIPVPLVNVSANVDVETFTQEFQLLSADEGNWDWIVGAFYMDDSNGYGEPSGLQLTGLAFAPAMIGGQALKHTIETSSISAFGELTYHFSDRTRLTGGLRFTQDEKTLSGETDILAPDFVSVAATIPTATTSEKWSEPTYKLALSHNLNEDVLFYGSYNRGFRSGSYNTVAVTGIPVNPEIADSYEVGFKSYLAGGNVKLNGAAYYTEYSDLQVAVTRGINTLLINAGVAEIAGLEIESAWAATDDLNFTFGLNLMETEYSEFTPQVGCTEQVGGITLGVVCDPQGNELQRAPATTFNVGVDYGKDYTFGRLGANANYFYTSEFFWEFDNRVKEDAYGLLNAQLYWRHPSDQFGVKLFSRNLTDEEYASFFVAQASLNDQYTAAAPRTVGIEFDFEF
jgi:iron complex outermembrane recepter protein